MGLAKNVSFYGLAAIAANVRKSAQFLGLYRTRQVQDSCVKNMKYWQKRQHNQATTLL
jgi:hypothetical protein